MFVVILYLFGRCLKVIVKDGKGKLMCYRLKLRWFKFFFYNWRVLLFFFIIVEFGNGYWE